MAFLIIESRVKAPLMPLGLFRLRNVATANIAGVLWAAAMFAWFFISALYLQLVLGYNAMQVGLSFLPANLIMAAFSLGLSAKIVMRFGWRKPLAFGLLCAAAGLALFARAPLDGNFWVDVLPGMTLLGIGAGIAFNPLLLGAMSDVSPGRFGPRFRRRQHGVHDGRRARPRRAREPRGGADRRIADANGVGATAALNAGYRLAFMVGAICAAAAGIIGGAFMRTRTAAPAHRATTALTRNWRRRLSRSDLKRCRTPLANLAKARDILPGPLAYTDFANASWQPPAPI